MGKLFESFERIDEERNHNIEGTGLGISIVTKLLAMMGSELKVKSVYGEGSIFSFELKQKIVDSEPIGNYSEKLFKNSSQSENISNFYAPEAKILVVDDNEMNLKVAKNLLKLNKITPELAASGFETVELMKNKKYDIVFLDHMMPKMDGIETLKKLHDENLIPKNTAIIALTANAVSGAREIYINAGFDDYLSKPIEVNKLEEKLVKYLPKEVVIYNNDKDIQNDDEILEFSPEQDEEIMEFSPDNNENNISNSDLLLKKIRLIGIDVDSGLRYCGGDVNFYIEILKNYINDYKNKSQDLNDFYNKVDFKEYQTLIHALKSVSKTIGAEKISELSKALENAAKENDMKFIMEHHDEFLMIYRDLTEKISRFFNA